MSLRTMLGFAHPDQPIECWYLVSHEINIGLFKVVDFPWVGRTKFLDSNAKEMKYLWERMPKGCDMNNPWLIVITMICGKRGLFECPKSEFIEKYGDIPLLPSEIFFKSQDAYFTTVREVLEKYRQTFP